ncbi:hypothetical protein [Caldalkalibacillus salinus]|uniref:hypothetical protein n=1 Tax=Caldalkalibacillus salinus TaxID=2803787 RepID=UPI0019211A82|nr:hypothetical protein [Caldalkalibacillus salinus]
MSISKRKKIYLILIVSVMLVSVLTALLTKSSFASNEEFNDLSEYEDALVTVTSNDSFTSIYFNNNIKDVKELWQQADTVVRGVPLEPRKHLHQATFTPLQVSIVLKGELKENVINIYEPSDIDFTSQKLSFYYSRSGYLLMENDREYILFLKKLPVPEGYEKSEEEERSYLPLSTLYAKYPVGSTWEGDIISSESSDFTLKDVYGYDILTRDDQILSKYLDFRNQLEQHDYQLNMSE